MWSIKRQRGFITVAFGCWCFQLIKAQQSQDMGTSEVLFCDELCEFSAWTMHAYCGERNLEDIPLQCTEVKTLDVRLNNIVTLRSGRLSSFPNLKYLYLVGNNLSIVEEGAFEACGGIQFLSWGGNNFPILSGYMLEGLTNLMYMLIGKSNIMNIEAETFQKTPLMKTLDMTGNKLSSPPCDAVAYENVITDLYISNNLISILPDHCFRRYSQLQRLKLSNNPIGVISSMSTFDGMNSIKKLEMDNTSLTVLPVGSFRHIPTLIEVILSKNFIEVLEERDFAALPEVEIINLEYNRIHTIHQRTFVDLRSLRILILSNNRISRIGQHAFLPIEPTLGELHLHGNQLSSIHNISSSSILSLDKFFLANNPLKCHCHLAEFRERALGNPAAMAHPEANATCSTASGEMVRIDHPTLALNRCPLPTPRAVRDPLVPSSSASTTMQMMKINPTEAIDPLESLPRHLLYGLIALLVFTMTMVFLLLAISWYKKASYRRTKRGTFHHNDTTNNDNGKVSDPEYASIDDCTPET